MRYELIIYWSKADDCFIAEVPELPGCMADGASYEEAVAHARRMLFTTLKKCETTITSLQDPSFLGSKNSAYHSNWSLRSN